jgi:hypothetical protein
MLSRMKISAFHMNLKVVVLLIGISLFGTTSGTCADETGNDQGWEKEMPGKKIEEVLKEHTPELMSTPGVVGTAQGLCDGQPCIKVFATEKTPDLEEKIPDSLEGYPVVIEETGRYRALPRKAE